MLPMSLLLLMLWHLEDHNTLSLIAANLFDHNDSNHANCNLAKSMFPRISTAVWSGSICSSDNCSWINDWFCLLQLVFAKDSSFG